MAPSGQEFCRDDHPDGPGYGPAVRLAQDARVSIKTLWCCSRPTTARTRKAATVLTSSVQAGCCAGLSGTCTTAGFGFPLLSAGQGESRAVRSMIDLWAFWDLLPTFAELGGGKIPRGLDGQSIAPTLMGGTQKPHEFLYWEFHERGFHQGVRYHDWKAIRYGVNRPLELYDIKRTRRDDATLPRNIPTSSENRRILGAGQDGIARLSDPGEAPVGSQ